MRDRRLPWRWGLVPATLLAWVVATSADGQRPGGPDPTAMAVLCTVERAFAFNSPDLERMGCGPRLAPLPPRQRPCEVSGQGRTTRLAYEDGRLASATRQSSGYRAVVTYENGPTGIVAVHGTNAERTAAHDERTARWTIEGEHVVYETVFHYEDAALRAVERAETRRSDGHREVTARWELEVRGRVRRGADALYEGDTTELEWDRRGRPIRFRATHEGRTRERTFRWDAAGRLVAITGDGTFAAPSTIRYECAAGDAP